ncbi:MULTISPECIES: D-ribose pyranase [unclassified Candidatus Frackibacter]|uniref:D-ribose pyranase n=1 Tax=unclassified Candidatus Frackibacter TaxID=2648818 RepID=UPI00079682C9|nr:MULTISPECIES: D-ribose pyranase [unclassified Candidatus Frackibacter]KXS39380.1 MAG: D-ribose pyranase [Candidatus Frackibacter sp. T328-2]SDC18283.1 ribose transport protein RbsD [Candidatus Frackibacter sp. WG11]SEM43926.1 ribose transport protein RbsD [Candidatus Frackibacter sp. WG12]SFL46353.1 ribose transport protein RbsD [Candidatus Frackibacter sp. WG13]
MKKKGILNSNLSQLIAEMGHTDRLVICDVGLPIPRPANRIDLALTAGIPKFMNVLQATLDDLVVEKAIMASEIRDVSPDLHDKILELLGEIDIEYCSHEEFKEMTQSAKGIVRTGEVISYANIILISGVDF